MFETMKSVINRASATAVDDLIGALSLFAFLFAILSLSGSA